MSISRSGSESGGSGPSDGRCALNWRAPCEPKPHVTQELVALRRLIQHPLMPVLGVLVGAGAAKSGLGGSAAGMILVSLSTYCGVVATAMLTRNLGAWVALVESMGRRNGLGAFARPGHS